MSHVELWNIKNLQPPPLTTYRTSLIDIVPLRKHFQNAVEYFESLNVLEQEAALLSRCIYRMKTKLRTDKGLKSMEKLNRALLQFNYLNLRSVLSDFISLLPDDDSTELYVPSKNMLDYVLVRLQGVTCLMFRAIETAYVAASSMGSRICIGHFWKVALIVLGVISRIWFICRDIMKYCCNFYKNIKSVRNLLKNTGSNWLPEQYDLPECLATWLDIDWVILEEASILNQIRQKMSFCDLVASSDVEECGNYIEIKDNADEIINLSANEKSKNDENMRKPDMFQRLMSNNDFGEVVPSSKQQNNTVINLSSDSENDSVEDFQIIETNNGVKSDFNIDKLEQISRIYGSQANHNESENTNNSNKKKRLPKKQLNKKRTACINVRDNVNDIIDISDNDHLEGIQEVTKPNALVQLMRNNNNLSQVVSSSFLHVKQSTNAITNLSSDSEDDKISQVYAKTEQHDIENTNNKKRKKKKQSSVKVNRNMLVSI